ncbi:MAG: cadmium-translocating P-type ATPase [Prevotella sp.]|nr:cadmium-translocating P-type ATPase [Prevotella sp.]
MTHEHHHNEKCCGHEHHSEHHHDTNHRRQIVLIAVSAVLLAVAIGIEHSCDLTTWQLLLVYLVPYLLSGHETLHEAAVGMAKGEMMDEHFLMSIATIGALCIGFMPGAENEFPEAVFVMLFFQIGELFESYAEGKSRASIAHLMDIRPDVAHVKGGGDVSPEEVAVGTTIIVRPGEKVPIDGIVIEGVSALNTTALTGESAPRSIAEGDEALSGCVNLSGLLYIRTTKTFGQSTVAMVIDLVENASSHKSKSETFITRFARVYTPIVVVAAVVLAVVPPSVAYFAGHQPFGEAFATWFYRALMFLVVSCPCALVISVPLTFFGGIGGASRKGILIKGANYIDVLAKTRTVVFDKTGTLTKGHFEVQAVHPETCDEHRLLHLAAHVEHFSTHPIGAALRDAFPDEATDGCMVSDIREIAGQGVVARVGAELVSVGNTKLMDTVDARWRDCSHVGTVIHVAIDGSYAGHIVISDSIKADSVEALMLLRKMGVEKTVMLTGDSRAVAAHVADKLGIDEYHAELLPADKVSYIDESRQAPVAFVGDGINDAPVLARADVGIAMGGLGSDAAIEAADVVLMDDKPSKLPVAIAISRHTLTIARQNVWFAIGVKVAVLMLATVGLSTMSMAVFADVGVTVIAVLNAMRALRK